ncbi:hypothetical protein PR048_006215 [Dryococelus australis]|uniref:Uncharacterized protein n=1 Tax=Dryococelus australis TaxID=614101 RepID=A0ABQ9IAC4_9NEOP|nr:hypothetical protein PR048_006215 [Dryococelus australis]
MASDGDESDGLKARGKARIITSPHLQCCFMICHPSGRRRRLASRCCLQALFAMFCNPSRGPSSGQWLCSQYRTEIKYREKHTISVVYFQGYFTRWLQQKKMG